MNNNHEANQIMIIVNTYKNIVIVNQLTDFEAFGGHKSIIQLTYHGETLQGLFRYLKRLFRGVTQRVRTSGERN